MFVADRPTAAAGARRPARAHAFCGFFVAGSDAKLTNNASQVVLMRKGNRTVMTMSNDYQGPPENFAMVVPVPVVLQKEDVKTLPADVFDRVDSLSAPRLVEYWEQDPCAPRRTPSARRWAGWAKAAKRPRRRGRDGEPDLGVKIEAQFVTGEYEIVILSATESHGPRHLAAPREATTSRRARPRRWRLTCATSRSSSSPRSTSRR